MDADLQLQVWPWEQNKLLAAPKPMNELQQLRDCASASLSNRESTISGKPRKSFASWVILIFAAPFLYLAALGPLSYLAEWNYDARGRIPSSAVQAIGRAIYFPAEIAAKIFPPYRGYLHWFMNKADNDAIRAGEAERKKKSQP